MTLTPKQNELLKILASIVSRMMASSDETSNDDKMPAEPTPAE